MCNSGDTGISEAIILHNFKLLPKKTIFEGFTSANVINKDSCDLSCTRCSSTVKMELQRGIALAVMLLVLVCTKSNAILHDALEIIDLSNVDLKNFQYFKNLPSQNPRLAGKVSPVIEHFQKKKAVLDYFENLFFGNSPFAHESEIVFDPHFGRAWRPYFERKYGRRGKYLIEMLGRGKSLETLRRYGAIPKEFGSVYYPS